MNEVFFPKNWKRMQAQCWLIARGWSSNQWTLRWLGRFVYWPGILGSDAYVAGLRAKGIMV